MFGIIKIKNDSRRIECCTERICDTRVLCVKIPKLNKRNLRRAARSLQGMRVVIPDECTRDAFEKAGMSVIAKEGLFYRMAFELYIAALIEFKLLPMKTTLLICATHFNDEELKLLSEFSKNARYISLRASNTDAAARYLLENYGVSVIENAASADVIINMYENNFSLHIIINGMEYILNDANISLNDNGAYALHIKGICTALLQAGKISPADIIISSMVYDEKFLDIQ